MAAVDSTQRMIITALPAITIEVIQVTHMLTQMPLRMRKITVVSSISRREDSRVAKITSARTTTRMSHSTLVIGAS